MNKNLAIVIPAYKSSFLKETLISIANQSCLDFTLYIGDDASPNDILSIVRQFENKIDIVYERFAENLGGHDLVAQWERSIALSNKEEWIWLFSDDDIMDENCVSDFYEVIRSEILNIEDKVLRFRRSILNDKNEVTPQLFEMPIEFDVVYLMKKQNEKAFGLNLTEYLFSRHLYREMGGYVNFPVAWGSDGMTVLKFGKKSGFVSLKSNIYWRKSLENLSSQKMYDVKLNAEILINKWLFQFLQSYRSNKLIYRGQINSRFLILEHYIELPLKELIYYTFNFKRDCKISGLKYSFHYLPILLKWKMKYAFKFFILKHSPFVNDLMIKNKLWR